MTTPEFPPWKVLQRLGTGTLTEVFLVEGPDGRGVLKRLLPFYADNELLSAAFILRAEEMRTLDHPGILRVFGSGTVGRDRYLVMEQAEGRALSRVFTRLEERGWQALPQVSVVACAYLAAKALAYAHSRAVFHLDVSLHNLYLSPNGELRLADFGLAHARRSYAPDAGGVEVIPPELSSGAKPDQRVDIWQLAAATYTLLAGGLPPQALSRGFPALTERVEAADETISQLLMRALSPIPAERPLAMAELVAGLGSWLDRVGISDAGSAAAALYRNVFGDGPQDDKWSVPTVRPWPDAAGKPHKVFAAHESTPTSPKGPLLPAQNGKRRVLWAAAALGALSVGAGAMLFMNTTGAFEEAPLKTERPTTDVESAVPELPRVEAVGEAPKVSSTGIEAQTLPLLSAKVPADFVVSSQRHGFFIEAHEGLDISFLPSATGLPLQHEGKQANDGIALEVSGLIYVPPLNSAGIGRGHVDAVTKGAFAVVTSADDSRRVVFVASTLDVPAGAQGAKLGYFTDRTFHRLAGDAQVYFKRAGRVVSNTALLGRPSIHLDDDERYTLDGLHPEREYELRVDGDTRLAGLVALLRASPTPERFPAAEITGASGGGGQYQLLPGVYRVKGALGLYFTLPRSQRGADVRFRVQVEELAVAVPPEK